MSRFAPIASTLLVSSLLGLGCDSSSQSAHPAPPATDAIEFKKLSPAEQQAAIFQAMGLDSMQAILAVNLASLANQADETCPVRTDEAELVTLDAGAEGCTTQGKDFFKGRVEAQNSTATGDIFADEIESNVDPSKPMELRFFAFESQGVTLDGSIWQSTPTPSGPYAYKYDISVSAPGFATRTRFDGSCDAGGCTTADGAIGEIVGKGKFSFDMTTELDGDGQIVGGDLVLVGKDTLTFDLAEKDANGCMPYRIDGAIAGQLCRPEPEPEPEPTDFFFGGGMGCGDDGWSIHTWVLGGATTVDALVHQAGEEVVVSLTKGAADPDFADFEVHDWAADLSVPASFTCDLDITSVRYEAVFADGTTACYIDGDAAVFADSEGCKLQ